MSEQWFLSNLLLNSHSSCPLSLFFAPCSPWWLRSAGSRTQGQFGWTVLSNNIAKVRTNLKVYLFFYIFSIIFNGEWQCSSFWLSRLLNFGFILHALIMFWSNNTQNLLPSAEPSQCWLEQKPSAEEPPAAADQTWGLLGPSSEQNFFCCAGLLRCLGWLEASASLLVWNPKAFCL